MCGQGEDISKVINCVKGKRKQVENKEKCCSIFMVLFIVKINYEQAQRI